MFKARLESKGLAMLQNKLKRLKEISSTELSNELAKTALLSVNAAKLLAPVDTGGLRNSIASERLNEKNIRIYAGKEYAPYIEFGTGRFVTFKYLQSLGISASYANQFKGNGIKKVNIRPNPFFFHGIKREVVELERRIDEKLRKAVG